MVAIVICRAILLLALLAFAAHAAEFSGRVVGVTDGDTLTVLEGTTQRKVRLLGIDAPERAQAFGSRAKEALSDLVFGRTVRVTWKARDKYGRTLGDVYAGGLGEFPLKNDLGCVVTKMRRTASFPSVAAHQNREKSEAEYPCLLLFSRCGR